MFTKSLWNDFSDTTSFPSLKENINVDVAIIGGGITGISTAHQLSKKGVSVAVLEASKVGAGTTSHSTGNLYSTVGENLGMLESKYHPDVLGDIIRSREQALNQIEQYVKDFSLDCDFTRLPWYMYSASVKNNSKIDKEMEAGKKINLPIHTAPINEIPFDTQRTAKIENQAQINPMRYVQGLAKALNSPNCQIYENTRVADVDEHAGYYTVKTEHANIQAKHVVHATHTPKGIKFVQTLLGYYREYGIACTLNQNTHPDGIYWGYFDSQEKISTRTYHRDGKDYLIVVGRPHKTGQAESNVQHIQYLEDFARTHFDVNEITHKWGGQHYRPADSLPYIGREYQNSNVYLATGFSTDGLVWGTLAASIIAGLITEEGHPYAKVFDSTRNQPLKSAKKFVSENLNVAKQYLDVIPGTFPEEDYADVAPGEGKVLEKDGEKIAVYKSEEGKLNACSAVCTHMACIVHWNNAEKTWDCPCHSSRFSTDGQVLEGPAYSPLKPVNLRRKVE